MTHHPLNDQPGSVAPGPAARAPARAVQVTTGLMLTFVMCSAVSAIATFRHVGLGRSLEDPLAWAWAWANAFVLAWPIAFAIFWFVAPRARRMAERLCSKD